MVGNRGGVVVKPVVNLKAPKVKAVPKGAKGKRTINSHLFHNRQQHSRSGKQP